MSNIVKYYEKNDNLKAAISKDESNKYTFFVIDKNVTWHAVKYFNTMEETEKALKAYIKRLK
jgi:hypothetical protein